MSDKYLNFKELQVSEKEGIDYRTTVKRSLSGWLIMAPHGGGIEPGTSEIAESIAKSDCSLYMFEGIKPARNATLHITGTRFDDPLAFEMLKSSNRTIAIHGCSGDEKVAFVGGRDNETVKAIMDQLLNAGFKSMESPNPLLQGVNVENICNKNKTGLGAQIELTEGLRKTMFESLARSGRTTRTLVFQSFVVSVRKVIDMLNQNDKL